MSVTFRLKESKILPPRSVSDVSIKVIPGSFCFRITMSEINNKSPSLYVYCVVDYRGIQCVSCTPTTQTILCPRTDWSTTGGPGGGSKVSVCWSHAPKSPISRTTCNTLISWTASTAKTTWYVFKSKKSYRGKTAWCIFKYKTIIAWQKQYGMHSKAKLHNPAKTTCCVLKNQKQHDFCWFFECQY